MVAPNQKIAASDDDDDDEVDNDDDIDVRKCSSGGDGGSSEETGVELTVMEGLKGFHRQLGNDNNGNDC
ncbi:hypothetical protein M0804_015345 [Polistes exclamans]|nr:hypothetical protein M0804_015345 [Polistes exclamans]